MNTTKKALLAATIALCSFAAVSTTQATPVTAVTGDVMLGFENAAGTLDYIYDLGQGSVFAAAVANGTFSVVNLNADLATVFGNDWATNATTGVQYGLFGMPSNKSIVYASVASGNLAPVTKVANALSTTLTHYGTFQTGYNTDLSGQALTVGVKQAVGTGTDTGFATWTGNAPSTAPFATYNVSFENLVSGKLDFYGTTGSSSTLEGILQISTSGAFGVVAVPEPSTYALFALGAMLGLVGYRSRITRQKA